MSAQRTNTRTLMQQHAAGKLSAPAPSHQASYGGFGGMTNYYNQHFAPAPSSPPPPAPPPPPGPPGGAAGGTTTQPFFSPDDLLAQANFWGQWNQTFAGLDQQLAQMKIDTAYQEQQLAQQHTKNVSGINDDAAARGLFQSSIKDGSQAQEQAGFTTADQHLKDSLDNFAQSVASQKNDFETNVLPKFNAAENASAVQNAQAIPPTPDTPAAPAGGGAPAPPPSAPSAPAATAAPAYKPVVKNGKFYHYYAAADGQPERWVYIRPASHS